MICDTYLANVKYFFNCDFFCGHTFNFRSVQTRSNLKKSQRSNNEKTGHKYQFHATNVKIEHEQKSEEENEESEDEKTEDEEPESENEDDDDQKRVQCPHCVKTFSKNAKNNDGSSNRNELLTFICLRNLLRKFLINRIIY